MEVLQNISYKLNEIFYSIQTEGFHSGMPAVFLRMSGCNMACQFCDTDKSDKLTLDTKDIITHISSLSQTCKNIIITGGEPTLQRLKTLITELKKYGYYICIETNGTNSFGMGKVDWITLSPKILTTRPIFCNEVKFVFGVFDMYDVENWVNNYCYAANRFSEYQKPIHRYLQPMYGKNEKETIEYVKMNPRWHLSVQWHKMIGMQ